MEIVRDVVENRLIDYLDELDRSDEIEDMDLLLFDMSAEEYILCSMYSMDMSFDKAWDEYAPEYKEGRWSPIETDIEYAKGNRICNL